LKADGIERATLGGGCFWCLEAVFEELQGVQDVASGYAGGHVDHPSYEQVCTGTTGHAEVVQVTFRPAELPYRELLEVFFVIHDPTTRNRQGADIGTQYRSIILYHSPEQKKIAQETIAALEAEGVWEDPVVTEVAPLERFWPAEEEHREYYRRNPQQMYCQAVIRPKLAKFRERFSQRLKT
jgi:peptide-methionine (S)-S-oxide reductase